MKPSCPTVDHAFEQTAKRICLGYLGAIVLILAVVFLSSGCASVEDRMSQVAPEYIARYCAATDAEKALFRERLDDVTEPYVLRLQTCDPEE